MPGDPLRRLWLLPWPWPCPEDGLSRGLEMPEEWCLNVGLSRGGESPNISSRDGVDVLEPPLENLNGGAWLSMEGLEMLNWRD